MKRVLLVDDHDLLRQVLAVVLEQHTDLKENLQAGSLGEARRVLADLMAELIWRSSISIYQKESQQN